ncbi:protease [Bacillus pseudomycoides]|uniref:FMN-binding negative transcriptional regulator n=1 Tax=Bacillus pseudomycoides TaxID=64104 RepID=UPI000BFA27D8|nr:FMN-binding negative transcriptional regulator [Bacillus pseudomycoides]PGE25875.1 protease [Bacillus pseudomycoides]
MYTPKYFEVQDSELILELIKNYSFGTLISSTKDFPIATHLPLDIYNKQGHTYLSGHFAYANHHWKLLKENPQVLVTFLGPHAYVSSSWYAQENVPTWNYVSVHVYGTAQLVEGEELELMLAKMLKKYEQGRDNGVLWDTLDPKFLKQEMQGIVGFKIKVEKVETSFKLSQNRNNDDYKSITHNLKNEKDVSAIEVANWMEKIRPINEN